MAASTAMTHMTMACTACHVGTASFISIRQGTLRWLEEVRRTQPWLSQQPRRRPCIARQGPIVNGMSTQRQMEHDTAWRMIWTIILLSLLAGLAVAKHAYVFDELAWTKQSWSDMKLRFPIETVLDEDEFGSYEHLSSKGTHSKASYQQALEEGMSHSRWASTSMVLGTSVTNHIYCCHRGIIFVCNSCRGHLMCHAVSAQHSRHPSSMRRH